MSRRKLITNFVFTLTIAFLPAIACADLLVNTSFETAEDTVGWPNTFGDWGGDDSQIVTAQQGINPRSGSQMLHHLFSAQTGSANATGASEVVQLIDLNPFAAAVASGNAVASGSVYVNRVLGDSETDSRFVAQIWALPGVPADFPVLLTTPALDHATGELFADGSVATWQQIEVSLSIPIGSTHLAFITAPIENIFNDTSGTEFDGHYSDDASVSITTVPEPYSAFMIGTMGLVAIVRRRRP